MKSILHVEDSEAMVKAVQLMLGKSPIEFHAVHNGKEALEVLQERHFDAILLDLDMPVMDGLTFLREFNAPQKNVMIVVCSARHDLASIYEAISLGAVDYIMKPFTDDILYLKLNQLGIL